MSNPPDKNNTAEDKTRRGLRAIDYIRDHCIEQRLVEYIGQVVHDRPQDPYGVMANQFASQSKPPIVSYLRGHEVLLSTGRPTLSVEVYASMLGREKLAGTASAPLGTSAFSQELKPHLDTNSTRFIGMGSKNACSFVEMVSVALQGKPFTTIDQFDMIAKMELSMFLHLFHLHLQLRQLRYFRNHFFYIFTIHFFRNKQLIAFQFQRQQ